MARPTVRPTRPYTNEEIFARIESHFFEEGNPRCSNGEACIYGQTGCAVGCLMTQEDADNLDSHGEGSVWWVANKHPDIFKVYFTTEQENLLAALQDWHDRDGTFGNRDLFNAIKQRHMQD